MVSEFRDSDDKLLGYNMTGKDKIKFEVAIARFDGRMVNMESHIQNFKYTLDKIMCDQKISAEKQQELVGFVKEWMLNVGTEIKKIGGEDGLEKRLQRTEESVNALKTGIKVLSIGSPIAIAVVGFILKFWKP